MCGICGFNYEDKTLMRKMIHVQSHRGPNDQGIFLDKGITLGNNRLAIIDISKKGHQPMASKDENAWITFNGEIYNFKFIREQLEKKGYKFNSNSDTEVLINAYTEYGTELLKVINGDFAFCIYDEKKKKLFLARDRLGIKPLYYYYKDGKFIFASEIKTIVESEEVKREVDYNALDYYLTCRYNWGEKTLFKNIYRVLPGHQLIFDVKTKQLKKSKYWELFTEEAMQDNENTIANHVRYLFEKSVQRRLMSDVPLGAYLSGGIDSSAVVGMMRKIQGKQAEINTFSVGFGNKEIDELPYAKIVAEAFNTNHKEVIVKSDLVKTLPEIIYHTDEPIADPALIPTYVLSKQAKKDVTVILTGEGGDELFAGYEQYKILPMVRKIKLPNIMTQKILPSIIKKMPKQILNKFFKYAESLGEEGINRFIKVVNAKNDAAALLEIVAIFDEQEKKEVYTDKAKGQIKTDIIKEINTYFKTKDKVKNLTYFDTKVQLPENFLMKTDKMTSAASLEGRVPFLDHELVEYAAKIPSNLKLHGTNEKYIFKKAVQDILPKQILERKKQRFYVPIDQWIKNDLKDEVKNLLDEKQIKQQGIFKYSYIQKIQKNYANSPLFYARQMWNLITFQIWYNIYIEQTTKVTKSK
ncbi:asparagine synthase (glutamine-hydrolyzing) [Candidatus Woesearchaeota archaeon]|nr:asparagine synthase (glutamine-hydrolyzing) [Candidatus Woesearchaeota archaeon]